MNRGAVLLNVTRYWDCPSCVAQHITREARPHVPMHPCPGQRGMTVPYVEAHPGRLQKRVNDRHHRVIPRGDYLNGERAVRRDTTGQVAMAVHTERRDGSHDTHVFAPLAYADPHPR